MLEADVDGDVVSTAAPFTIMALPGSQSFESASGTGGVAFTVNPNDTVSYASTLQGTLTGTGTSTLTVVGDVITVNATALSTPYAVVDYYISVNTAVPVALHLLPGAHFVEGGGGMGLADFTVNPNDTVSYASNLQGALTGTGASTLVVVGEAVTVNATALSTPYAVVDYYISVNTAAPVALHLLPGAHFVEGGGGMGLADFTVNPNDTVSYASNLQGALTGHGTSTLGVVGEAVTVNATALSTPYAIVDYYISVNTTAPVVLHLLPGSHFIEGGGGMGVADFTVNPNDTVSYATSLARGPHRRRGRARWWWRARR